MTKASDNAFPSILITEGTEPSAPAAGKQRIYIDSTSHHLMRTNSSGTETDIEASSGGDIATDTIWDAAGDLVQGTGSNAAARLASGLLGQSLRAAGAGTAVAWAYPPGYEYSYQEVTSDVSITATAEASATTIVTADAVTFDGSTVIYVEFYARYIASAATSGDVLHVWLYDGSSSIGLIAAWIAQASVANRGPCLVRRRLTPSAASHTYSMRATVTNASRAGTIGGGAGGSGNGMPTYIRVIKA